MYTIGDFGSIYFSQTIPRARSFKKRMFLGISLEPLFSQNGLLYDSAIFTNARQ
tara:strand:+ start:255 stop:416 length:162 start_codon:yes stop_codon:yes gene_type:complete